MSRIDYYIDCPHCGGTMELEDSSEDFKHGILRPVWAEYRCPECGHRLAKDFCVDYDFEER